MYIILSVYKSTIWYKTNWEGLKVAWCFYMGLFISYWLIISLLSCTNSIGKEWKYIIDIIFYINSTAYKCTILYKSNWEGLKIYNRHFIFYISYLLSISPASRTNPIWNGWKFTLYSEHTFLCLSCCTSILWCCHFLHYSTYYPWLNSSKKCTRFDVCFNLLINLKVKNK